jgi:hypothetical protein
VKGHDIAIPIPEEEYSAGVDACKHNLHGRIIWPKGSTPLTVGALKNKLSPLWKDLSKWGVSSLGRGFYEFVFSTLEDVRRVRSSASWNLNPGLLKLFAWSKDFNPRVQQNASAQVWVRFYGLSQEYWRPNILFAIASSVGTPICIDAVTAKPMMERTFGQFVRVLVDMDLTHSLRDKVLVERKGFAFFVELDYENLPPFCSHCQVIGHHVGNCKKLNYVEDGKNDKEVREKRKIVKEASKIYVQTNDGRKDQNCNKDVINVDSDKFDDTLPLPFNDTVVEEVNSKASKAVLVGPSSSILNNSKTTPPHISNQKKNTPPVLQQNRFSLLDSPSEDSPHTPNQSQHSSPFLNQNNFLPPQNILSTNNSTTQSSRSTNYQCQI